MAFFVRDGSNDDLTSRRRGKATRYHAPAQLDDGGLGAYPSQAQTAPTDREKLKDQTAQAMQSYENPILKPTYDPLFAYGGKPANNHHHHNHHHRHGHHHNEAGSSNNSNNNSPGRNDGNEGNAYQQNVGNNYNYNYRVEDEQYNYHQQQNYNMLNMRDERPLMPTKKMVSPSSSPDKNDANNNNKASAIDPSNRRERRDNGNIIAPTPLPWDEAKPKIRGKSFAGRLTDEQLLQIAGGKPNDPAAYKESQAQLMAQNCGGGGGGADGGGFHSKFSQQPTKKAGHQKVAQEAVHAEGIGIWGFNGLGKMSEESSNAQKRRKLHIDGGGGSSGSISTSARGYYSGGGGGGNTSAAAGNTSAISDSRGLSPSPFHLQPLESKEALVARIAKRDSNNSNNNNNGYHNNNGYNNNNNNSGGGGGGGGLFGGNFGQEHVPIPTGKAHFFGAVSLNPIAHNLPSLAPGNDEIIRNHKGRAPPIETRQNYQATRNNIFPSASASPYVQQQQQPLQHGHGKGRGIQHQGNNMGNLLSSPPDARFVGRSDTTTGSDYATSAARY